MVVNEPANNNTEPPFRVEDKVMKGKVISLNNQYTSVGELLFDSLKNNPDIIGQVDAISGVEDTFADILDRTIKCALWLQRHGVGKGDIVVISSHNHLDTIIPYAAALYLGAVVNAWDYAMNVQLARYFLALSQPKVIFANEKSVAVILEAAKIELYHLKMVCFGYYPGTTPFSETLKGHSESAVKNFRCREINDPSHAGLILFSSGTTGMPKGVQLSHKALINAVDPMVGFSLCEHVPMWFSSLYWISGSLLSLKSIISCTKRIIGPEFDEKTTCEIIEKFKITWLMLSTSMANRLARYTHLHDYDLSSLQTLFTGGATMKQESQDLLKNHFSTTSIVQAYGMTELGGLCAAQLSDTVSGSCGVVSANCEIKVIDIETGEALGPNEHGELCAKTMSIMTEYLKNPEATKNTIDEDGWVHTGDLAYYNEKGEIFIMDRLKELMKYRGHQITPTEIENVLQSHPAVLEAAVVGIPHPIDDEHPIAFVSKIPDKEVSAEELIKMVASNLMDNYKLRGGVRFLPSLPHTHSGKISKKELKAIARTIVIH
ncbi:4-coumarate--CoA ligase 1-like isoform X2 [Bombus pyrosoma]|uniref:4-coumarate--CoA ligase 1-like isoform X2 n=1 Tax=Bombus pyrosoma TaxID=396416 RepID=UPI001CB99A64|nr:4-coumarate--CoA ligase 1-like isoform X2 [Bombus pyrosoma]